MPDEHTLTLRQANQIRTDIANLESGLEVLMAQLARQKGDLARASRPRESGIGVHCPYRCACSVGSGST
jgi:hypothetical protein